MCKCLVFKQTDRKQAADNQKDNKLLYTDTMNTQLTVNSHVVKVAHTAPGHSQKKEISPGSAGCYFQEEYKLKYVTSASCVTQLSCVKPVTNVKNAASNLPVGARLQNYWQTWLNLDASPKVVQILREGTPSPFGSGQT